MTLLSLLPACVLAFSAAIAAAQPTVVQIPLSMSNVHLIRSGAAAVLVDAGGKSDLARLEAGLGNHGLRMEQISLAVLTHGHSDHAGLGAELTRRGVPVMLGRGDLPIVQAGHNDELKPTNFTARLLKRFAIDPAYEPFTPAIVVDAPQTLERHGIAGQVLPMPGHTPGSLVVLLADGRAFVGDMMLGGWLGGALLSNRPGEHYFQADAAANRANIAELLRRGVSEFHLGHGGPVSRAAVIEAFGLENATTR